MNNLYHQTPLCCGSRRWQAAGRRYFCKFGVRPEQYSLSAAAFQLEFRHMRNLEKQMAGREPAYGRLFPRYYRAASTREGIPYIMMEEIPGQTLEAFLCGSRLHKTPAPRLGKRQLSHLFEQLHTAILQLYQGRMLQIDLSPQNILLVNDRFDIRLVDFTGCYYTDLSFDENAARGYGKIDYRIDPALSPSLQLRDACALLFTRLFFSGNAHYGQQFLTDPQNPRTAQIRSYFDHRYPRLLDCVFAPDNPSPALHKPPVLDYWESWHRLLRETLS